MARPFSQTIRALHIDSHYLVIVMLSISILLLLFWLLWFFTAPVSLIERTQTIQVQPDITQHWRLPTNARRVQLFKRRRVIAIFPEEKLGQFYLGQAAWINLAGQRTITARVIEVKSLNQQGYVTVETEFPHHQTDVFTHSRQGQVAIEVAKVAPAALVFHLAGFYNLSSNNKP